MSSSNTVVSPSGRVIDGHRLAEFVYGTVTGMVAIAGMGTHPEGGWLQAAGVVVAGAVAIWLAHGYSIMLAERITAGRRLEGSEIARVFANSWPIVIAGAVLAIPILLSALGLWSVETSIAAAGWLGVVVLGLVGILAGAITRETWGRRFLIAALSAGLGILVVAVEFLIHH